MLVVTDSSAARRRESVLPPYPVMMCSALGASGAAAGKALLI